MLRLAASPEPETGGGTVAGSEASETVELWRAGGKAAEARRREWYPLPVLLGSETGAGTLPPCCCSWRSNSSALSSPGPGTKGLLLFAPSGCGLGENTESGMSGDEVPVGGSDGGSETEPLNSSAMVSLLLAGGYVDVGGGAGGCWANSWALVAPLPGADDDTGGGMLVGGGATLVVGGGARGGGAMLLLVGGGARGGGAMGGGATAVPC